MVVFGHIGRRLAACCVALFLFLLAAPDAGHAESVAAQLDFARDGERIVAALNVRIPSGFHAYAHENGDAGRPTVLDFFLEGDRRLPVWYPEGTVQRDFYDPDASIFVYEGEVTLFAILPDDAGGSAYAAKLSLLLCSPRQCLPVSRDFSGTVPQTPLPVDSQEWAPLWEKLAAQAGAGKDAPGAEVSLETPPPGEAEAPLPPPDGFNLRLAPRYDDAATEVSGLWKALLLGIAAGLFLNLMPCVLPVLTLKVSGLLLAGGRDGMPRAQHFRAHNFCFAAGILSLFTALALLLGLADLMWGQHFQQPEILLVMLLLVFLMGLSMLGVFTLPIIDLRFGENASNPYFRSYMTGLVATFLATPCSGPLLGGVLGWAFTQPLTTLLLVFWAVGLGMSLPYLLLGIYPELSRYLPRPGPWMQIFESVAGFCLLGTALYMFSILPPEKHTQVLTVLLFVAFLAWIWGRFCGIAAPPLRRRLMGVICCVLLVGACVWILRPVEPLPVWRMFTPKEFTAQLGKKPILLEFTAEWCPNCKFMEATVLTDERMRAWQSRYGMILARVDLTAANPWGLRLLEALGSKSIPLTAIFPSGEAASLPIVLRDVYSAERLEKALREAVSGN